MKDSDLFKTLSSTCDGAISQIQLAGKMGSLLSEKKLHRRCLVGLSGVDTGCFGYWYTNFEHTNLGAPKFNFK